MGNKIIGAALASYGHLVCFIDVYLGSQSTNSTNYVPNIRAVNELSSAFPKPSQTEHTCNFISFLQYILRVLT